MAGACALLPPVPAAAGARAEMVAALANMAESALAAAPAPVTEVSGGDPRRAQAYPLPPGAHPDRVPPPLHPGAGPRAHRLHAPPVPPARADPPASLAPHRAPRS